MPAPGAMPASAAPPLVLLVGPTAVGKTAAAVAICRALGAEVVNADSVQVYRGLDLGSAKPTAAERAQAPHHLVDVADPDEEMSAARWAGLAEDAIADIARRGRRALVAGGTGLYVKALVYGLAPAPPVDAALRARLRAEWDAQGGPALHARLAGLDPQSAARLHPADRQRVLRALEFALQTGEPISRRQAGHGFSAPRHPHLALGLDRPRPELNQRIETRCRAMWAGGLLDETRGLLAAGLAPSAHSLNSLGYRQAVAVLMGRQDEADALAEMIRLTKAYAKRQLTWFRGLEGIKWHHPDDLPGLMGRAREFWNLEA
ncbi:MAG: tRNA (adenosine(37)-N6)-dimethylallyltransferase MiaA [Thermodesulfobacteriota bacterium]